MENTREQIILRIERLKSKDPVANANLIKKWERKLRSLENGNS